LPEGEFERQAAQRSLRALGTATPREIHYYFPRGRYRSLRKTLADLREESVIRRVQVTELGAREERYVHREDVPLLESMPSDAWGPRMTLLAPFDNLICSTARTDRLFGFHYIHENFLPPGGRILRTGPGGLEGFSSLRGLRGRSVSRHPRGLRLERGWSLVLPL
jgi:uncharacterized protein YcaQ